MFIAQTLSETWFDDEAQHHRTQVNTSGSGGYSVLLSTSTPTAVPEPFTIIGTLVGGTAAVRMRKKLAANQK